MERALALLLTLASSCLLSAAASAATLSIATDKASYATGEAIVITVTGDSEGAVDFGLFGQIDYDTDGLVGAAAALFTPLSDEPGNPSWIAGGIGGCSGPSILPGECVAFNLVPPIPGAVGIASPEPFVYAIIGGVAGIQGAYSLEWNTTDLGNELRFFGLTSAPGATFVVTPEPSTALLLALGLIGLAIRPR